MTHLSIDRILWLWSELEDAWHGCNGFGGDTAEIYVYRFLPYCPTGEPDDEEVAAALKGALEVMLLFQERRNCRLTIGGRTIGDWFVATGERHRFHVSVSE